MRPITAVIVLVLLAVSSTDLLAQASMAAAPIDLCDSHTIGFSGGAKTNSRSVVSTNPGGVSLETGFIGLMQYGYWFDPQWQLNLSLGIFGAKVDTDYLGTKVKMTAPILFGVAYYPIPLAMGKVGRPFIGVAPGVYVQTATRTSTINPFATETTSETVLGARISAGADLFPARWFRITPVFSYHLIGDFKAPNAGSYSGAEFSLGFGVVL